MGIHAADAIVLRRYFYRETSVVVSCLTDRYGKLKGLIKGLRQLPNRHRSAMEPMTVNRIVFYDTHTSQLHLISQCELLAPLAALQQELEVARSAALCVDLVDTVVPLNEPQPAVYRLLKSALEHLAVAGSDPAMIRTHFIVRFLRLAGFQPQVDECTGCGAMVHHAGYWSAQQGGLLCANCLHEDPKAEPVLHSTLETLERLSESDQPIALDAHALPGLRRRLDEFLRWRLDRPLKTLAGWTRDSRPETRVASHGSRV
ncbi:MAG: DNA repair protein RecO [Candidatus Omnitrophica bacterium]|nr:DNA repair protein RecO [Candidatus Omnitrophota bacterium]